MDGSPREWNTDPGRGWTAQLPLDGQQQDESASWSEPAVLL